jgi:cytochrome c5
MKKYLVILSVFAFAVAVSGLALAQEKAPTVVILKGAPLGGVKFDHAKHSKLEGAKCDTCHHASKPEKPSKTAHEKCQTCHTKAATAPMKTNSQGAFHVAMAKGGLCIDCHTKAIAAGKKAPAAGKCAECHKKENV